MTNPKATTVLRVSDLSTSLAFYVDLLGLRLCKHDPTADIAIIEHKSYGVLLAGPTAGNFTSKLSLVHSVVRPGATLFLAGGDLDAAHTTLRDRGARDVELIEKAWGDRSLIVRDPDGYTVSFWIPLRRTPAEILTLYEAGPDALDAALGGLRDADLDRPSASAGWTIRQLVHHLADSEATALSRQKFALAEPGRLYQSNAYDQDIWADALGYADRPIEPSVALFRAIRAHIAQLMRHLPDAWERATLNADGQSMTVGMTISMLTSHAQDHIDEVAGLRAAGCGPRSRRTRGPQP